MRESHGVCHPCRLLQTPPVSRLLICNAVPGFPSSLCLSVSPLSIYISLYPPLSLSLSPLSLSPPLSLGLHIALSIPLISLSLSLFNPPPSLSLPPPYLSLSLSIPPSLSPSPVSLSLSPSHGYHLQYVRVISSLSVCLGLYCLIRASQAVPCCPSQSGKETAGKHREQLQYC